VFEEVGLMVEEDELEVHATVAPTNDTSIAEMNVEMSDASA